MHKLVMRAVMQAMRAARGSVAAQQPHSQQQHSQQPAPGRLNLPLLQREAMVAVLQGLVACCLEDPSQRQLSWLQPSLLRCVVQQLLMALNPQQQLRDHGNQQQQQQLAEVARTALATQRGLAGTQVLPQALVYSGGDHGRMLCAAASSHMLLRVAEPAAPTAAKSSKQTRIPAYSRRHRSSSCSCLQVWVHSPQGYQHWQHHRHNLLQHRAQQTRVLQTRWRLSSSHVNCWKRGFASETASSSSSSSVRLVAEHTLHLSCLWLTS